MKKLRKFWLIGWFVFMGGSAMADDRAPGATEIAMDIGLTSGKASILVDDVPFFGPGQSLEAEASINASLPANAIFGPGQNDISLRFWPAESGLGNTPGLKVRFGYAPADSFPDAFTDRPYAVMLEIHADPRAPMGFSVQETVQGQPLMNGQLVQSSVREIANGGVEAELSVEVGIALPPKRWISGQVLTASDDTARKIEGLMHHAYTAFENGPTAITREFQPMLERQAAAQGMSVETLLQTDYAPFIDHSMGFDLKPFKASGSRLVLMGGGRLATLLPQPVMFVNKDTHEEGGPFLAFWRDTKGDWQIMH